MTTPALRTLEALLTRDDDRLEVDDANLLITSSRDGGAVTADERAELRAFSTSPRTTLAARNVLETFLDTKASNTPAPLRAVTGAEPSRFTDDALVLGPDGSTKGTSSVTPYTRAYDAVHTGPLREAHGSPPPRSSILTDAERAQLETQTPAEALDAAARERGLPLGEGFVALSTSKSAWDPEAPSWWGKCHAWAWSALSTELSARVDVGGPEGERGLWLSGQWLSRADLGNFLMGVSDTIALADDNELFQGPVSATDLLEATAQYLLEGGGGFVADLHNDAVHGGEREVWNQPFVAADVDTKTLTGEGAAAVLKLAHEDGHAGVAVKHVHLVGRYGNERADDWEGAWNASSRSWNLYAVTDASGRVLTAYMADDARLDDAQGLPTRASHELPEYIWKPTLRAVTSGLAGTKDPAIDTDALATEYRFLVGTVLTHGVPGARRAAFEAEVAALPAGALSTEAKAALQAKFSGVAEAYTGAQWARAFGSRGLAAKDFGH